MNDLLGGTVPYQIMERIRNWVPRYLNYPNRYQIRSERIGRYLVTRLVDTYLAFEALENLGEHILQVRLQTRSTISHSITNFEQQNCNPTKILLDSTVPATYLRIGFN